MKARTLILLTLVAVSPGAARADFNLQVGVKWEPWRYTLPQSASGHDAATGQPTSTGTAALPSASSVNAFQRQSLNALLGVGFTDHFALTLGFDLARATLSHTDSDANAVSHGFTTLGFSLGVKYNFVAPRRETISPYLYADFFKYFTALNDDHPGNLPQPEVEFSAGMAAPLGFRIAFGVEYWFTDSFGLGAEIFGLQGAFSSGSVRRTAGDGSSVTHEQALHTINFYSALTLTFRFPRLFGYGRKRYERYERDRD
jgi:hypothetical protein